MKKETFFDYKNWIFQSPKNRILFSKGLTHAFGQNMPIFSLFKFDQTKPRNNAFWLCRERKTFFALKKQNFSKSKKSAFPKLPFFSLFRFDQNNTRNNAFWLRKEKNLFLTLKNGIFQSPKNRIFSGDNSCFWWKNANYLFYLDLVEIRLEIMLGDFAAKKETFLTIKNRIIQTQKNRIFPKA